MSMSIVERLRDQGLVIQHPERKQIADLIEQQAKRIKEQERENEAIRILMNCYNIGGWTDALSPVKELAALRKRIDDAPVVMQVGNGSLINKEDLQK